MSNGRKIRSKSEGSVGVKFKVCVFGGSGVGKSSIISRYLRGSFKSKYTETIEDLYKKELNVDGINITLDILDTSGNREYSGLSKLAIYSSNAFILVYSLSDIKSFEEVEYLRDQIIAIRGHVPIVIVANKVDVESDIFHSEKITLDALVSIDWCTKHIEASAKYNVNINCIFKELIEMHDWNVAMETKPSKIANRVLRSSSTS